MKRYTVYKSVTVTYAMHDVVAESEASAEHLALDCGDWNSECRSNHNVWAVAHDDDKEQT